MASGLGLVLTKAAAEAATRRSRGLDLIRDLLYSSQEEEEVER